MDVADAAVGTRLWRDRASSIESTLGQIGNGRSQSAEQCSHQTTNEKDNIQRRLKTFVNWAGNAFPIHLSIAGFIFIGPGDKVQCETCKVKLYNWEKEMVPLEEHRENSPNCSFLKKWFPVKSTATSTQQCRFNATKAKYQGRIDMTQRLSTFEAWPLKLEIHSPHNMARAGFFYIGSADRARCFYCGLTLRDWDTDDDPFEAHLQWSPKCEYINHVHKEKKNRETKSSATPPKQEESKPVVACTSPPQELAAGLTVPDGTHNAPKSTSSVTDNPTSSSDSFKWKYSTQFEAVMAMGFQPELIQMAIDHRISTKGDGFPDVTSLFLAVEELASTK